MSPSPSGGSPSMFPSLSLLQTQAGGSRNSQLKTQRYTYMVYGKARVPSKLDICYYILHSGRGLFIPGQSSSKIFHYFLLLDIVHVVLISIKYYGRYQGIYPFLFFKCGADCMIKFCDCTHVDIREGKGSSNESGP